MAINFYALLLLSSIILSKCFHVHFRPNWNYANHYSQVDRSMFINKNSIQHDLKKSFYHFPRILGSNLDETDGLEGGGVLNKALFTFAEYFGYISSSILDNDRSKFSMNIKDFSELAISQKVEVIRKEYENVFWATGNMDVSLWENNCTFADPFSSFGGEGSLLRFKRNADNLGKFVNSAKSVVKSVDVVKDGESDIIRVDWTFSSKLKLPWRPILAASGVTSHYISRKSGKIYKYVESWKSKPLDVILRLFKPT